MVNKNVFYLVIAVTAALILAWWLWPNDKQAIRKHLESFTEISEKKAGEQGVEALTKAARLADLFTDPCRVVFEEYDRTGEYNKKAIIDHALFIRNQFRTLSISFMDTVIRLSEDQTAMVTTTVQVDSQGGDELFRDIREVDLSMEKRDGDWLIAGVTLVQVLEK